ncbi:zinc finger, CCHC-type containing protein [Tanacetum coccineum]
MDGNVHTLKARLVEKGYTQTHELDYGETFSHVADNRAIRILLAIAALYDYEIWKMDVKTSFSKWSPKRGRVYGATGRQTSRSWNKRFDEEIKKIGFTQNPDEPYVYLKASGSNVAFLVLNTKDMVLVYGAKPKDELKVSCYADASFQTDKDNTKCQMGYVFVLNGGVVAWKSAKQSTTDMSSTEAEYIAAAEALMIAVWMRKFIDGLGGVMPSNKRPMEMRKYHCIREVIQRGEIVLKKVHTDDNVADPFTKPMSFNKHFEHAMGIGIVNASSLM